MRFDFADKFRDYLISIDEDAYYNNERFQRERIMLLGQIGRYTNYLNRKDNFINSLHFYKYTMIDMSLMVDLAFKELKCEL